MTPGQAARQPRLSQIVGVLILGVSAASTGAIFGRLALDNGASAIAASAYRVSLAAVIVIPLALMHRRSPASRTLRRAGVVAGLALGAHFGLWIASLAWTSVASSVALVTSHPLMVAATSAVFIGERPSRGLLAGVSFAVVGVIVITVGDGIAGPQHLRGDLLALGGAAAFAVYVTVGRFARAAVPLLDYVAVVYSVAAIGLLATGFAAGQAMGGFRPVVWFLFLGAALIPQLLGHSSFNWALGHVSATYVSAVVLAEVVGSAALAWALLGERPPGLTVVGAALIVFGLFLATRSERRRLDVTTHYASRP